jgi:hypothetical protein
MNGRQPSIFRLSKSKKDVWYNEAFTPGMESHPKYALFSFFAPSGAKNEKRKVGTRLQTQA